MAAVPFYSPPVGAEAALSRLAIASGTPNQGREMRVAVSVISTQRTEDRRDAASRISSPRFSILCVIN